MKNIAIKPEDYTILAVDDIATNIMLPSTARIV